MIKIFTVSPVALESGSGFAWPRRLDSNQDSQTIIKIGYSGIPSKGRSAGRNLDQIAKLVEQGITPDRIYQETRGDKGFEAFIQEGMRLAEMGFRVELYTIYVVQWNKAPNLSSLIRDLEAKGIHCYSIDYGRLSVSEREEELRLSGLSPILQAISDQASDRVKSSLQARMEAGIPVGGKPPFGYKWNSDKTAYEPDPDTWGIARFAVDVFLDAKCSTYAVSQAVKKHHGIDWAGSSISRWLRNETIKGCVVYRKEGLILPDKHEALVTEAEFEAIQKQLERNRTRAVQKGILKPTREYAISSGLCRCDWCGSRLASSSAKGYRYFRCRRCDDWKGSAYPEKVEEAIISKLSERVSEIEAITPRDNRIEMAKQLINPETWETLDDLQRKELYQVLLDYVVCRGKKIKKVVLKF